MSFTKFCVCLIFASSFGVLSAQETRSTLTGFVADSTGARIPNASIAIKDADTGVVTNAKSNSAGAYTVPFLQPGHYDITASAAGFKSYSHSGLVLVTEQVVTENITLPAGEVSETVTVSGASPMVDTADATTGQTLTSEELMDLPSNGRSPLGFARYEYGAVAKGKHDASQTRPFDNSTADDFSLGGGASASNELLLNGVPNMEDSSRTAGFSPQLDGTEAVHVDEFSANANMGDSSGGTVNITTKSGTNQFHGAASEYYQGSRPFQAKPYFTPAGTTIQSTHFNQFGGTIGGPIWRNKIFFQYSFEGFIGSQPATTITSVPTTAERTGDFSQLLTTTSSNQLYNPYSGVYTTIPGTTSKGAVRTAIPNNVFSNAGLAVSPIAQAYLAMVPLPNYNGSSTRTDGENNYFASDPTQNNYKSHQGRIDIDATHADRLSFELHRSESITSQANIFYNALSGTQSDIILWGGFAEDVHTFSPSTNLDFRLGFSRYQTTTNPNSVGINPTSLGFPSYLSANAAQLAIPYLSFTDPSSGTNLVPSLSAQPGSAEYFDDIQLYTSLNKTWGHHTIKIGPDIRLNKNSSISGTAADGAFSFKSASGDEVTANSSANPQAFGGSLALFELGLPTSGSLVVNPRLQYNEWYLSGFAQDDWKVKPNFTLSVGLRVESETSITESGDRVVAGFNPTATNAATVPAEAAYAKAPSPYLPASAFQPTGGLYYASPSQRYAYYTPAVYLSPRIGFSYSPDFSHGTLAIRGGFGIYVNPFNDYNAPQAYGYTGTSTYLSNSTNLNTQVPVSNLSDPFNNTVNPVQLPYGSSLGVNTQLGSSAIFFAPLQIPYNEKGELDVQKQVGKTWLFEVTGFTSHSVHLSSSLNVSAIPLLPLLARQQTVNTSLTSALNASVTNPFKGLFPSATTPNGVVIPNATSYNTASTISSAALLQQYPQYSSVTEQLVPNQNADFDAVMFKLQKRMSHGLQFDFNYIYSRLLGAQSTLNQGQTPAYGETSSDFPQHASLTLIYQLPFGRNRQFFNQSRIADEVIGGWQVTSIYQALSGAAISWGNAIYTGNWHDLNSQPHNSSGLVFNTASFDKLSADQPNSYNYRTFPQYLLRQDANNNFDFSILKNFTIGEHVVVQPRVDAFNALNHVQFGTPNVSPTSSAFGTNTTQLNSPRQLQGGIHVLF